MEKEKYFLSLASSEYPEKKFSKKLEMTEIEFVKLCEILVKETELLVKS